ncbi:hypothetical protein CCMSSC00406_0003426 [Pleurotus cornucopiae]|uniref:Uncharacterized protein n=1 Tax=Pleurotus cornucopiae TaxID=5321 RepID=A0ACB7J9Y4_PLECO|nr:hypothetical protein CCMSSC00406_0003426 [Pleurotus cornucopiae]
MAEVVLANGTNITLLQAREFLEFYHQFHNLQKPTIMTFTLPHLQDVTSAVMMVGSQRLANGKGKNKQIAIRNCQLKAAINLELYDPELWKAFVAFEREAKTRSSNSQEY